MTNWTVIWTEMSGIDCLINIGIKSTLLVVFTYFLSWILQSATLRHVVWKYCFIGLFFIPFICLLPGLSFVFPSNSNIEKDIIEQLPLPYANVLENPTQISVNDELILDASFLQEPTDTFSHSFLFWVLIIWSLITSVFLLYIFAEVWYTKKVVSARKKKAIPNEWNVWLKFAKDQMQIIKPVRLLVTDESMSPYAFGWRNPLIILPKSAIQWEKEKLITIFLHELGHIRQGDFLINLFALFVKAIYWWNPMVWFAAKQLQLQSEYCCDELVLDTGLPRFEYAEHLVGIARSIYLPRFKFSLTTIPILNQSQLKKRILGILSKPKPQPEQQIITGVKFLILIFIPLSFLNFTSHSDSSITLSAKQLIEQLDSPNQVDQIEAAKMLGELKTKSALPPLVEKLKDQNPELRATAAWALGQIKEYDAVGELLPLLNDQNDCVKEWTLLALGEFGLTKAFYSVIQTQEHPNPEVRKAFLWSLYQIGCLPAFHHISQHLDDDNKEVEDLARELLLNFPKDKLRSWMKANQFKETEEWTYQHLSGIHKTGAMNVLVQRLSKSKAEAQHLMIAIQANPSVYVLEDIWNILN